ncbi:MAG: hypothetical protein QXW67_03035 [Candidatus Micrarchaeia archaeon]
MNFPFTVYREFKALDIFKRDREYGEVLTPVSGKLIEHKIHTICKNGIKEHTTIIDCESAYVKILYADPSLNVNATTECR